MRRLVTYLGFGLLLIIVGIGIGARFGNETKVKDLISQAPESFLGSLPSDSDPIIRVTKIVDGDTIVLSSGKTLRYIGIDTPERGDCFFEEAKIANEKLVLGKEVRLEKDVSETDRYKRLLRYVWADTLMVNEELVNSGNAIVSTYPPDVAYQNKFLAAQKEARENKRGIWADGVCQESSKFKIQNSKLETEEEKSSVVGISMENDKDCSDFKTHDEAQAFYVFQGGPQKDPHKLDNDGDGEACETLP